MDEKNVAQGQPPALAGEVWRATVPDEDLRPVDVAVTVRDETLRAYEIEDGRRLAARDVPAARAVASWAMHLRARVAKLETHNLRLRTAADDAEDALRDLATFGELDTDRIAEQRRALRAAVDAPPVKPCEAPIDGAFVDDDADRLNSVNGSRYYAPQVKP